MSDWRHQPDAPESAKYHGGYDPADPPDEEDAEPCLMCGSVEECDCRYDSLIGPEPK